LKNSLQYEATSLSANKMLDGEIWILIINCQPQFLLVKKGANYYRQMVDALGY